MAHKTVSEDCDFYKKNENQNLYTGDLKLYICDYCLTFNYMHRFLLYVSTLSKVQMQRIVKLFIAYTVFLSFFKLTDKNHD